MSDTAVLRIKVDSSGAVAGATAAASSLDRLSAAASRSAAATMSGSAAFAAYKGNATHVVNSLQLLLREQTGLAAAYAQGGKAVERYNLQLKIEATLAEAGVAANTLRGRAIVNQVTQLEGLRIANERAAQAARELDAAHDAALLEDRARAFTAASGGLQDMAMKAMGTAAAIGVLVSVLKDFTSAAMEAEENARRLASAVNRKGVSFLKSAVDLENMATKLEAVTRFEDDAIQKAMAILLRFDEIDSSNIEAVTRATLDFAEATEQDAASAATAFGKALLVPGEAMRSLKEVGITLTQQQQDMVDAWNATGDSAKSVSMIVGMLSSKIGREAEEAAKTGKGALDQFAAALGNLKERLGDGIVPKALLINATELMRGMDAAMEKTGATIFNGKLYTMEFNEALRQAKLDMDALKDAAENARPVIDGALRHPPQPIVPPKTKEELKAAADAVKEYRDRLQDVIDKADPYAAKQREILANAKLLREAFKVMNVPLADQARMMAQITGDWSNYGDAIEPVTIELLEATSALEQWKAANSKAIAVGNSGISATKGDGKLTITSVEIPPTAYEKANEELASNLQSGLEGAFSAALVEFANGGEDALKHFGESLLQIFIQAVAEYLAKMLSALAVELSQRLSNVAVEASARQGASVVGSGTGAIYDAAGNQIAGTVASSAAGGGGGAMSGLGTFVAVVAVFAAAVAMFKHQTDRHEAMQYGTTSGVKVTDGVAVDGWTGKLDKSGPAVAAAIGGLLNAFQTATGAFMEGIATAEVEIRNDKKSFRAVVNGLMVGEFATAGEAIIAAAKEAFLGSKLSKELDPIMRQLMDRFTGEDPQKLIEAMQSVQSIIDEISAISEVEVALRELPSRAAAMAGELVQLGVTFDDATDLANRWKLNQMNNLRDQITGRQRTAAEEMAERQRQAAMFNAEVTLLKAETQLKRDDIAARVAALRASGNLFEGQVALDKANLSFNRDVLMNKADLYDKDAQITTWYLDTLGQSTNASLMMLEAQLSALDAMLANMPDLIRPGDIHLGGGGGNFGSTGPSEREQREESFRAFMDQQMADSMGDLERRRHELDAAFEEQERAARELGQVAELEAARVAAIARMREEFLDQYRDDGLSDYQRAVVALNEAFAEQALLNAELAGSEAELERVRRAALAALREDLLDSFGSPLEALRDSLAEAAQRSQDLSMSNKDLAADYQAGRITAEEYAEALRHAEQVQGEFNDQMAANLLNMALYFTEALGDSEASADIRARLAEFEYNLKLAEFELTIQTAYAQHWINQELYEYLLDILEQARRDPPDFTVPQGGVGGGGSSVDPREEMQQQLLRALDRLRAVLQTYTDFLRDLQTSELSPYSIEDQYGTAQAEYLRLLALAQAGNLEAMEALPNAAQTYLELAAQMFGTGSAGYQEIFQGINSEMTDIMGGIQDILDAVPSQYRPMEERLDTIAEILSSMYLLQLTFGDGYGGGSGSGGGSSNDPNFGSEELWALMRSMGSLSMAETSDLERDIARYLRDGNLSAGELSSFVSTMENYLGMTPGAMTPDQIEALRLLLLGSLGNAGGNSSSSAASPDSGQSNNKNSTPSLSTQQAVIIQQLEMIAHLTAKSIREAKADRMKRPSFSPSGYTGGSAKFRRGS